MTLFEIVALYVAINILILIYLSWRVTTFRQSEKINLGDGGHEALTLAMRAQGNFTEYAPLALIGLLAMAWLGASPLWLHGIGISFVIARLLHAFGISGTTGKSFGRFYGTALTFLVLLVTAIYLIVKILN